MTIKAEDESVVAYASDGESVGHLDSASIGFATSEEIEAIGTFNNENFEIDVQEVVEKLERSHEDRTDEIKFSEKGTLMYGME